MRSFSIGAVVAGLCFFSADLAGQNRNDAILSAFDRVSPSVIRIRTIADLQHSLQLSHHEPAASEPYSVDGTGVVVGEMIVEGRREYLILTNHHVADASTYVLEEGGYLRMNPGNTQAIPNVREESYLMEAATDAIGPNDLQLIELVRQVEGDMTLMRTSGATKEMVVFGGAIGYAQEEELAGGTVLTGGYPWAGDKIVALGTVIEDDFPHQLGIPHNDLVVDLPVEPGQSGGPIFLVEDGETAGEPVTFRLIGLVHAKDDDRNYGVPYTLWSESLKDFPSELQSRLVR